MSNVDYSVIEAKHERELMAESLLYDLIGGKVPRLDYINKLYGYENLVHSVNKIENFIEQNIEPYLSGGMKVRPLSNPENSEIVIKQIKSQTTSFYRHAEEQVKLWDVPSGEFMEEFYGDYADFVLKNFLKFQALKKTRKCFLQYVNHLVRVSVMADEIGFDMKSGKPAKYYVSLWAMHDSPEDLSYSIRDIVSDKIKYGLEKIPEFLNDFIPQDMHDDMMMITNKSDLILKYLDAKNYSMKTKHEMDMSLAALQKGERYRYTHENVNRMREVLANFNTTSGRESFFEEAKWEFYKKIFINDLAEQAYEKDHFALFEGKGFDLFDNCISTKVRDIEDKKRSILKIELWGRKAEEILARVRNKGKDYPFVEGKVLEMMNYANSEARLLLIDFLAANLSRNDHLTVGMEMINELKPVLYTDKLITIP